MKMLALMLLLLAGAAGAWDYDDPRTPGVNESVISHYDDMGTPDFNEGAYERRGDSAFDVHVHKFGADLDPEFRPIDIDLEHRPIELDTGPSPDPYGLNADPDLDLNARRYKVEWD